MSSLSIPTRPHPVLPLAPCTFYAEEAQLPWPASPTFSILSDSSYFSASSHTTCVDRCWTLNPLPRPATVPGKVKYLPPCRHIGLTPGARVSCLVDDLGRSFVMASSMAQGTFGKLKPALNLDDTQGLLCIKEARLTPPAAPYNAAGKKRTTTLPWHQVVQEFHFSNRFGGSFAAEHCFRIDSRAYTFYPLAKTNLYRFAKGLTARERSPVARAVAKAVGGRLADMARAGAQHGDVSASNILVSASAPFFELSDFGNAYYFHFEGHDHRGRALSNTYTPPEAVDAQGYVTGRTDPFSLGAVLLLILHPDKFWGPNFLAYAASESGELDEAGTKASIERYFSALGGAQDPDSAAIIDYIRACREVDQPLTSYLIHHVLVPHRQRRSPEALVAHVKWLESEHEADDDLAVQAAVANAPDDVASSLIAGSLLALRAIHHGARLGCGSEILTRSPTRPKLQLHPASM